MGSQTTATFLLCSSPNSPRTSLQLSHLPFKIPLHLNITATLFHKPTKNYYFVRPPQTTKTRATLDEKDQNTMTPLLVQEEEDDDDDDEVVGKQPNKEVEESVKVLKNAAKTRKIASEEVLSALSVIEKAKLDPSGFLGTLGGSKSPGRTWMLIFTAEKRLERGNYFPITAVQRFDAAAKRIENGVYLGPLGYLTFEGRFSWKKRILAFIFERIRIKFGPFNSFELSFGGKDDREPSKKDPFFIWFYVDEEIVVGRGKSGGTAFWVRCRHNTRSFSQL